MTTDRGLGLYLSVACVTAFCAVLYWAAAYMDALLSAARIGW